jgi:cytoskeletal protein RodZ
MAAAFAQTMGARIRQVRRSRELSQEAIAEALDITPSLRCV